MKAKNERRMVRKPATKFPNLQKKLQKGKIQAKQVKTEPKNFKHSGPGIST